MNQTNHLWKAQSKSSQSTNHNQNVLKFYYWKKKEFYTVFRLQTFLFLLCQFYFFTSVFSFLFSFFFFCTTDIFLNPFGKPRYSRCYQAFWRIGIAFLVTEKHWNIGEYWYKMSWISFFVQTFFVQKVNLS